MVAQRGLKVNGSPIRYLNQSGMDGEMARALMLDEESYVA